MSIKVVTDSTSDIPPELAEEYGITVLPSYVNVGSESYLDLVELSREEFYRQLPTWDQPPTTAAPATGTFTAAYERLAEEGATAILSIHLASSLSGMLNAARLGAQATERVPVTLFDSQQISMGLGLLALSAAKAAASGASMSEIVALLDDLVPRTHIFAALDTLTYLRRSGRVSWAEFGVGTILRIKPLLHVHQGNVDSLERVRTHSRAIDHLIQHVADLGSLQEIALLHAANPDGVETLRAQARHLFPEGTEPVAVEVTPTIGSHVGPGALGFALITAA
jgi:DegV family protein with EDD domain